jgi:hypothetical protein
MGKHKNKRTPKPEEPTKRDVFTDFTNPLTPEKIFEVEKEETQDLIVDGDIDPVEKEANESAEDHMRKLKEQGKTLVKPIKKDRISFSEMLRNRRKSTKRN